MFGNSFPHKARTALFLLLTATAPTNALGINCRGSALCDFFFNTSVSGNEAKVVRQDADLVSASMRKYPRHDLWEGVAGRGRGLEPFR